jgi:hypothetical protein
LQCLFIPVIRCEKAGKASQTARCRHFSHFFFVESRKGVSSLPREMFPRWRGTCAVTQVPTYLPGPEELKARVFERCTNNNKVLDCNTTCGCERRRAIGGAWVLWSFVLRFSLCVFFWNWSSTERCGFCLALVEEWWVALFFVSLFFSG